MIGFVGYGAYVPRLRIKINEIAKVWNESNVEKNLLVKEKSVPENDEDVITMSVEAGNISIKMANINPKEIGIVLIGSESHPYDVKPSGTVVAEALGITPDVSIVDTEFACRAGSTNIILCAGFVNSGYAKYGLAIGADTAQAKPGDALEYTAGAGAVAFIIGKKNILCEIVSYYSYVTDTPDFFRKKSEYPVHAGRFTGEPGYFKHTINAINNVLEKTGLKISDFDYCVFHMPNGKFPLKLAKILKIPFEKLKHSFVVDRIGNLYSASSLIGLARVLDYAEPNKMILFASYGSGAGSDAFVLKTTELIKNKTACVDDYIESNNKEYIDYSTYAKLRNKLVM